MKSFLRWVFFLFFVVPTTWGFFHFYSYIFSRKVVGVVIDVKQLDTNVALLPVAGTTQEKISPSLYAAFSVAIKEGSGEIVTASAEDRQWAVVHPGHCAEAVYYPYPPWKLDKAGTYFGARLQKLTECKQP
jgi:hypothetical protein